MREEPKPRPPTKAQRLDAMLAEIMGEVQLDGWTSFVEELSVPRDALPALMSGRAELIAAIQPRALSQEEATALYKALGVLIRTNMALQRHAEQVSILVGQWGDEFKALRSLGHQIKRFADFKTFDDEESD